MKFWSIITLLCFLNFTALPSIATIFDWDTPTTNIVYEEEEEHSSFSGAKKTMSEECSNHKTFYCVLPKKSKANRHTYKEPIHSPPHLNLFSPPPEV